MKADISILMTVRTLRSRTLRTRALCALLFTAGTVAALSACSSAPTRLFTLYPVAPNAPSAYVGPPIRVDAVHLPPALDRIELVSEVSPGELKINDLEHWSAPLSQEAREALSADLIARLPPGSVLYPHLVKPDGALGLSVDILELNSGASGASLQASWVIAATNPAPVAIRGTASLRLERTVGSSAGTAHDLSSLLGQLADHIVSDLTAHDRT
jgi:uncharacterized lipoprotein YmbA